MSEIAGRPMPPRAAAVVERIALKHGLPPEQLIGPGRQRKLAVARQELYHALYEERRFDGKRVFSLPRIGKWVGGRDHTTVHYGIKQHKRRMIDEGQSDIAA